MPGGLRCFRGVCQGEGDPGLETGCGPGRDRTDQKPTLHRPTTGEIELPNALLRELLLGLVFFAANDQIVSCDGHAHRSIHEERDAAEHLLLGETCGPRERTTYLLGKRSIVRHRSMAPFRPEHRRTAFRVRTLERAAMHARVVAVYGLEIGEKRVDSFVWARGVHFAVDGGHGFSSSEHLWSIRTAHVAQVMTCEVSAGGGGQTRLSRSQRPRESLASLADSLPRRVVDDLAACIERDLAARLEQRSQLRATALDTRLHAGDRDADHLGGFTCGEPFQLDQRDRLSVG